MYMKNNLKKIWEKKSYMNSMWKKKESCVEKISIF